MSYDQTGYSIVKIPELEQSLKELRQEIFTCFSTIRGTPVTTDAELIEFYKQDQPRQYLGVRHARNCFGMMQLGGSRLIFDKLISDFGFKFPTHDVQPGLRCDMPVEDQRIFFQHQDYTHNIGSDNSVTVWIPLQDTNEEQGALLVAPGTHKLGPIDNIGGIIPAEHKFDLQPCPIKFGEALIFDQKLVHQSGRNISKDVRFSIQMRVSDLGCPDYRARDFAINNVPTNVKILGDKG